MGMRTRTLNPTTNPTANPMKNPAEKVKYEIDLLEEEKNIIAENKRIQEMKKQLETIQMRIPRDLEIITSPAQQKMKSRGKKIQKSPKGGNSEDSEEEIQLRRGSDGSSPIKEPENRGKIHKEPRTKQKKEEEKGNDKIYISNIPDKARRV